MNAPSMLCALALFALGSVACGGSAKAPKAQTAAPETKVEPLELIKQQLAQVELYCSCQDEPCKDAATAEVRRLSRALMREFVAMSKKTDFDPNAPSDGLSLLRQISDRVEECGIPRQDLIVEVPKEIEEIARARMAQHAEKARKRAEEQIATRATEARAACDKGDGQECFRLAEMTQDGEGVPADQEKAYELVERACELGHGTGCQVMGDLYREEGGAESLAVALSFFEKGCDRGDSLSCSTLSEAYLIGQAQAGTFSMGSRGLGIKKNKKKSDFYAKKAKEISLKNARDAGLLKVLESEDE